MNSLRTRVIVLSLAVISMVLAALGLLSYRQTISEFQELGDARLVQATRTIDALAENAGLRRAADAAPTEVVVWRSPFIERTVTSRGHVYEIRLGFQYWNDAGRLQLASDNFQHLPWDVAPGGFADITLPDGRWRVFTLRDADGDVVRVGERDEGRSALARALLWEHLMPLLLALAVLAVLVGWAIRRALRPLEALSHSLSRRQPDESSSIVIPDVPRELQPVLTSLNGLVSRVHAALERERRFAADAAHQLRTPLAAAMLHLENAAASDSAELRSIALTRAQEGLGRLQHLVNQFLELARWDSTDRQPANESVDLQRCVCTELEEAALLAAEKDLELTIDIASGAHVLGWDAALQALARNLIDNAFRYTPPRGRVEVRLFRNEAAIVLEVSDSGPGIPAADRVAVLERFRRGQRADVHGSGLGLAIVRRVADLHGAIVELCDSRFGNGLCVRVLFPGEASKPGEELVASAGDASCAM